MEDAFSDVTKIWLLGFKQRLTNAGDYISYMTPQTKDSRREKWRGGNFAGSIDWAVDLQEFSDADWSVKPKIPENGQGCISGEGYGIDSGELCEFACTYGFCESSSKASQQMKHTLTSSTTRQVQRLHVDARRQAKFPIHPLKLPAQTITSPGIISM